MNSTALKKALNWKSFQPRHVVKIVATWLKASCKGFEAFEGVKELLQVAYFYKKKYFALRQSIFPQSSVVAWKWWWTPLVTPPPPAPRKRHPHWHYPTVLFISWGRYLQRKRFCSRAKKIYVISSWICLHSLTTQPKLCKYKHNLQLFFSISFEKYINNQ